MPRKKRIFQNESLCSCKKFSSSKKKQKIVDLSFKYETFVLLKMAKLWSKYEAFIFQKKRVEFSFKHEALVSQQ
jgi:hypothetical protein